MVKTASKPAKQRSERPSEVAQDIYRLALVAIREEIRAIQSGKVRHKKFSPVETTAYLAKQASTFAAELRKVEAAEAKRLDSYTLAGVVAWARRLDPSELAALVRSLSDIGGGGSVLG
jgi:hypothetical protein